MSISATYIGKIRGMQQMANEKGIITVTAIDHRGSLKKSLQAAMPNIKVGYTEVVTEKLRMTRVFAPHSSAILVDPVYGASQIVASGALPGNTGLLVSLEESGYDGTDEARITPITEGWSIPKIKSMGAAAVKLLLYYHPNSAVAAQQEELVVRVAEECRQHDIALLLEPMSYPIIKGQKKESAEFAADKPQVVLESARRLSGLGIDLLKAEFPSDPHFEKDENKMRAYCRELTAISPVPWVILSAAENFDTFQGLVEIACEEGASGFLVGRAIWQEGMTLGTAEERQNFLETTAISRLGILSSIANYRATPWNARYTNLSIEEGWHKTYSAEAVAI
ncbi:tagatose 1,6-diphosphate aldolase [Candidatus Chlorohelix sp.]|uniref:tagatose 1,6-diphosphate aldolase n=1 Tax=Candidatus Chlorohelix sp. TaxID=3139201 RepID=UPI00304B6D9D